MKATKIFMMAALALTFAACSNDDNDFAQQPAAQPVNGEITITATLDSNDGATTRALSIDGDNIASTWETTDEFAILFNDGTSNVKRTATVSSINGSNVTITFTIPQSLANNTACTIVYPASAANAANTGADVATALATQDGTIGNCPEVRVGTATINKDNHSLSNVSKLAAQNAIFKFTVKNSDGSATINVKPLTITIGAQDYVITPASATSSLYAALPAVSSQTVSFSATGSDSKTYTCSKDGVTFAAGNYYQSTLKMAKPAPTLTLTSPAVGQVIGSDGKNYAANASLPTGVTKAAMIAYVSGSNGLAIALADEGAMKWAPAVTAAANHTPVFSNGTWKLPSEAEWKQMFSANGGNEGSYTGLNTALNTAGGNSSKLKENGAYYWSSTEPSAGYARRVQLSSGNTTWGIGIENNYDFNVRACLAF